MDDTIDAQHAAPRAAQAAAMRQERADIAWLMSGPRGRRIVWRMLERSGVFRQTFTGSALPDAFAQGQRNEGLRLLAEVHALPEYQQMVAENAPKPAPVTATDEQPDMGTLQ